MAGSLPQIWRKLFENNGQGPNIKSGIIPIDNDTIILNDDNKIAAKNKDSVTMAQLIAALAAKLDTSVYNADAPKRILASGRINSNGSIAYGINIASCTVLGTGRRSITMAIAASSANYEVFATIDGGATLNLNNVINFGIDSKTTFRIGIYVGSSVWADQSFNFIVVGN